MPDRQSYGAKFYTPPPPTPEKTLLGVGGVYKRGGAYKIPAAGASKYTPPPLPPKIPFWPKMGEGGGGAYIIFPWKSPIALAGPFRSSTWNECYTNESRHNNRRVDGDQFLCFRGRYDRQGTLVIRIAAITLASDLVITVAQSHPKHCKEWGCWDAASLRERKMSLEFFRLKFFREPHLRTQMPGCPDQSRGTSKSRDIPASGSLGVPEISWCVGYQYLNCETKPARLANLADF